MIPAYSEQGSAWTPLATLTSAELGAGLLDGYYRRPDGSIVVFTRHTGDFALLQDIQPPTKPTAIVASLVKTTLRLAWPPSADNSRRIRAYQILRGKKVVRTIPGGHTVGTLNLKRLTKSGSYSVRAIDDAGNAGATSRAVNDRREAPAERRAHADPGVGPEAPALDGDAEERARRAARDAGAAAVLVPRLEPLDGHAPLAEALKP